MSTLLYISACVASFVFVLLYLSSMLVVVDRIFAGLGISGEELPPVDNSIEGLPYRYISLYGWVAAFVSAFLTILTLAPGNCQRWLCFGVYTGYGSGYMSSCAEVCSRSER